MRLYKSHLNSPSRLTTIESILYPILAIFQFCGDAEHTNANVARFQCRFLKQYDPLFHTI